MEIDPTLTPFLCLAPIFFCLIPLITVTITVWVVYLSQAENAQEAM